MTAFHITGASALEAFGILSGEDRPDRFTSFDTAFDHARTVADRIYIHGDDGRICKRYVVQDFHDQLDGAVHALKEWLGEDGLTFFTELYDENGKMPISIHLREGMQVRNFLRQFPACADWNCPAYEFFDYIYMEALCRAIDRPVVRQTVIYRKS